VPEQDVQPQGELLKRSISGALSQAVDAGVNHLGPGSNCGQLGRNGHAKIVVGVDLDSSPPVRSLTCLTMY
jgi:hypothetical protein